MLCSQYHGCWWYGDTRRQDTNSRGIDIVIPECSGVKTVGLTYFPLRKLTYFWKYHFRIYMIESKVIATENVIRYHWDICNPHPAMFLLHGERSQFSMVSTDGLAPVCIVAPGHVQPSWWPETTIVYKSYNIQISMFYIFLSCVFVLYNSNVIGFGSILVFIVLLLCYQCIVRGNKLFWIWIWIWIYAV